MVAGRSDLQETDIKWEASDHETLLAQYIDIVNQFVKIGKRAGLRTAVCHLCCQCPDGIAMLQLLQNRRQGRSLHLSFHGCLTLSHLLVLMRPLQLGQKRVKLSEVVSTSSKLLVLARRDVLMKYVSISSPQADAWLLLTSSKSSNLSRQFSQ